MMYILNDLILLTVLAHIFPHYKIINYIYLFILLKITDHNIYIYVCVCSHGCVDAER